MRGNILNIYFDKAHNCLWMNSNKNIFQLSIENEDRDVWKAHLEKKNFQLALDHCAAKKLPQYNKVARIFANYLYENQSFTESALMFAKSDEKFEEVALKFLMKNEYDSLKS